jgi:signal transduction histidine kinase
MFAFTPSALQVSHEVRTPLNSCMLGLDYLDCMCKEEEKEKKIKGKKEGLQGKEEEETVGGGATGGAGGGAGTGHLSPTVIASVAREIRDSCEDAVEMVNNLLLYEKVDGDALALSFCVENLYHMTNKVVRSFNLSSQQLGVYMIYTVHPSIISSNQLEAPSPNDIYNSHIHARVYVDRAKIHVVIKNMISNALKFSSSSQSVSVRLDPVNLTGSKSKMVGSVCSKDIPSCQLSEGTHLRVSVVDMGPGISSEDQKKLFQNIVQVCTYYYYYMNVCMHACMYICIYSCKTAMDFACMYVQFVCVCIYVFVCQCWVGTCHC